MCCSCMHHLLSWVASYSFVMHHTWLCVMSCLCVMRLLCCVLLLDSSCFVASMRIRLSSWLHLLHRFVLLPSGISGKMTVTLDLITIIAMLVASFYRYAAYLFTCSSSLPNCHEPLTFVALPSKPLFGYVTALLSPSYSVASGRWRWRLLYVGLCLCWDTTISLILLMHLYTW